MSAPTSCYTETTDPPCQVTVTSRDDGLVNIMLSPSDLDSGVAEWTISFDEAAAILQGLAAVLPSGPRPLTQLAEECWAWDDGADTTLPGRIPELTEAAGRLLELPR